MKTRHGRSAVSIGARQTGIMWTRLCGAYSPAPYEFKLPLDVKTTTPLEAQSPISNFDFYSSNKYLLFI
jgi:hypothetical protein